MPRTATITAKTNSTVWVFDRQNFKNILMKASSAQIKENRRHLDRVLLLESLFQEEKEALAEILVEMSYSEDGLMSDLIEPHFGSFPQCIYASQTRVCIPDI